MSGPIVRGLTSIITPGTATKVTVDRYGRVTVLGSLIAADIPNLPASIMTSGQLGLVRGGSGADLSLTGGANQIVRQNSVGGAFTVSALTTADIPYTPAVILAPLSSARNVISGATTTIDLLSLQSTDDNATKRAFRILNASGTELMSIAPTGAMLVTGSTSTAPLQINSNIQSGIRYDVYSDTALSDPQYTFTRGRGTIAVKTDVQNGDRLLELISRGFFNAGNRQSVAIMAEVDAAPSGSIVPGRLILSTTSSVATVVERLRLDSTGQVIVNNGNTATSGATVFTVKGAASGITSIFQANATTPGNLTEWRNSAGTLLTNMNSSGQLHVGGDVTSFTGSDLTVQGSNGGVVLKRTSNSEPFVYLFNNTTGSGGLMRGLDSGGVYFTDIGLLSQWLKLTPATSTLTGIDTSTASVSNVLTIAHILTTANSGANGIGTGIILSAADSSGSSGSFNQVASIKASLPVATHASRTGQMDLTVTDATATRTLITIGANNSVGLLGFFGAAAVIQQVDGAGLTNNVTVGGTTNQIDDFVGTLYATDAATIRNNFYQLSRKLKIVDDAIRLYGLLT